ncbi:MAG: DNA repair protein RadA [Aquificae bacterium]|nr:DNA repair protein RadA [Aquificota bacterium]
MKKGRTAFVCQSCGYRSVKWMGRCPSCGEWNAFLEEPEAERQVFRVERESKLLPVDAWEEERYERTSTGYENLDRALGGGLVKGQVCLIAGEPGIGKSTLLLQVCGKTAKDGKVLYVSGEESGGQIAMRARRLGIKSENLLIYPEVVLEKVEQAVRSVKPSLLVLDSVQTVFSEKLESSAGSVSQVREVAYRITELCKELNVPAFIVGQITKEGSIAGPKVLEHIVDAVLQFEGERFTYYRVLKVVKNRFGSTGEIAVFKMGERGLEPVPEPSAFFISERAQAPGSVVFPHAEGSKPVLLEVQSLVIPALYTTPQRRTQGYDPNRLSLLLAVLEKEAKLFTRDADVFVNVAGGMEVKEPAADLAVAVAVVSSKKEKQVPPDTVVFGEVGLAGEVRAVHFAEQRLKEAGRFGFKRAVVPAGTEAPPELGIELLPVSHVSEALELLF